MIPFDNINEAKLWAYDNLSYHRCSALAYDDGKVIKIELAGCSAKRLLTK